MSSPIEREARRAHRVLQAIWIIVSAQSNDAVARDVAELGEKLKTSIDSGDSNATRDAMEECRSWLSTMAGVVTARMQHAFED